uniref:Psah1 n=2 Tax=Eukaryota TaxID=2759 RepID=A0AC62AEM1_DUNTE|mmetsp:Transcript_19048/g.53327  ORF Transcript_19048/g.53327 Transcript_19048/m.53327 type:complete len:135 (+) Transcript_19048:86-490(+)
MALIAKTGAQTLASRRPAAKATAPVRRSVKVCAKYGEQSKYFDLQDLENTTGAWDMYGVDEKKRYPGMQEEFFQRATDAVSRRESLNGFVALSGIAAIALFGLKGASTLELPITKGPRDGKTENGKGGILRSRV